VSSHGKAYHSFEAKKNLCSTVNHLVSHNKVDLTLKIMRDSNTENFFPSFERRGFLVKYFILKEVIIRWVRLLVIMTEKSNPEPIIWTVNGRFLQRSFALPYDDFFN
jgi:hypothetical protein